MLAHIPQVYAGGDSSVMNVLGQTLYHRSLDIVSEQIMALLGCFWAG